MRKISLGMNVSLDGFVAGPDGQLDWIFHHMDPAQQQWVVEYLRDVDTIILGRSTYLEQAAAWPSQTSEMADLLNRHAKIVFSKTLESLDWNNSRLATRGAAEEIAVLKEQPGKMIYVSGGASIAQSFSRLGLIDEYNLFVHPVVLGAGKRLFASLAQPLDLKLVNTRTFDSGAVLLTYERA